MASRHAGYPVTQGWTLFWANFNDDRQAAEQNKQTYAACLSFLYLRDISYNINVSLKAMLMICVRVPANYR
jgi:hypothetical protein